ncbi:MAG: hypothetical protein GXP08_06695 [Gammaproteobacteria bacterium]|nr:hypothetical protein [Gammaproteobacteria bacterium]
MAPSSVFPAGCFLLVGINYTCLNMEQQLLRFFSKNEHHKPNNATGIGRRCFSDEPVLVGEEELNLTLSDHASLVSIIYYEKRILHPIRLLLLGLNRSVGAWHNVARQLAARHYVTSGILLSSLVFSHEEDGWSVVTCCLNRHEMGDRLWR